MQLHVKQWSGCVQLSTGCIHVVSCLGKNKVMFANMSLCAEALLVASAGHISVQHNDGTLKLDDWATFKAPARIAVLIRELREQVDRLLLAKVADPALNIFESPITTVMQDLLAKDGF